MDTQMSSEISAIRPGDASRGSTDRRDDCGRTAFRGLVLAGCAIGLVRA